MVDGELMVMMGFGIVYMLVFWAVVIGLAIWLLGHLFPRGTDDATSHSGRRNHDRSESPLDVLKRRYARGELSQEEYDKIRSDLRD
jgi:putative membrane protein